MEKRLTTYLNQQFQTATSLQEEIDFSLDANQLTIDKIKSCKNTRNCLDYVADDIGLAFSTLAEAFLANYCCEACTLYGSKTEK